MNYLKDWYYLDKREIGGEAVARTKKDLIETSRKSNVHMGGKGNKKVVLFRDDGKYLKIPRYYGLDKFGEPDNIKFSKSWDIDITFNGKLDPKRGQPELVKEFKRKIFDVSGGILCAPCGTGKTVSALYMLSKFKTHTLVLVHKEFIMNQWIDRIDEFLDGDFTVGVIQQDKCEYQEDIVIGMMQSIYSREYPERMFESFGVVCADECFTGNTEVTLGNGEKRSISKIVNNEYTGYVMSYDEDNDKFVKKRVTRHFKKKANKVLKIRFDSRFSGISCTVNHKIKTDNGMKRADELKVGDTIICRPAMNKRYCIPHALGDRQKAIVAGSIVGDGCISINKGKEKKGRLSISHSEKQTKWINTKIKFLAGIGMSISDSAISGFTGNKIIRYTSKSSLELANIGNKFTDVARAWAKLDPWLCFAIIYFDNGSLDARYSGVRLSKTFADEEVGYFRDFVTNDLGVSFNYRKSKNGYGFINFSADDSRIIFDNIAKYATGDVEYKIPKEFRSKKRFGKIRCKPYGFSKIVGIDEKKLDKKNPYVYNIEVEDTHLYIVGKGYIVSNCHHLSAPTFFDVATKFNPRKFIGLSATPKRGDGLEGVFFKHVGPVLAEKSGMDIKGKVYQIGVDVDMRLKDNMFNTRRGKFVLARWINKIVELHKRTDLVVEHAIKLCKTGRKVMVLTHRLNHVDEIVEKVDIKGHNVDKCVGGMSGDQVSSVFDDNDIIVGTFQFISEAVDVPDLSGMVLATPSANIEQAIGRLTRLKKGKKRPIVTEFVDVWSNRAKGYAQKHLKTYEKLGFDIAK